MIALLGGFATACLWATSTLCSSRSSRILGSTAAVAWVMVVGLLVAAPVAIAGPLPVFEPRIIVALTVSGITNVLGLLLAYAALRIGKVGVIAPILSTEGALAAVIAVVGGERLAPAALVVLMAIATGIFLASRSRDEPPVAAEVSAGPGLNRTDPRAIVFALAGAAMFGVNLYATGWLGSEVPLGWVVLPARVVGVLILALPLAAMGRLPLTRRAAALVTVAGIAEVAGTAALAAAARDGIAVASVLASQFGAIAAVVALIVFRERLARVQVVGVATIACGVAILAALRT